MIRIIDTFVNFTYSALLSFAALIGLIIMPPVGIVLFYYLRGFLKDRVYGINA